MNNKISGIYKITNCVNNKYYIGSSFNIKNRLKKHFLLLRNNKHHSIYLQNAYNKYGKEVFNCSILIECDKNNLLIKEQELLDDINDWSYCYNMSKIASGCSFDLLTHPKQIEIREKISKSSSGRNTKPFYIKEKRYEKLSDATNEFNVGIGTISYRIKNWKNKDCFYENKPKWGNFIESKYDCYFNKEKGKKPIKKYYCSCGNKIYIKSKNCKSCAGKKSHIKRPVIIMCKKYASTKEASLILKIKYPTLLSRIKSNTITFKDYYYIDSPKKIDTLLSLKDISKKISSKLINKPSLKKSFHIYNIYFNSILKASKILKISKNSIMKNLKNKNNIHYIYVN